MTTLILSLSNDLRDALRYEHAYKALSTEVDALVIRNELVEREADHLSQFNAEILGHANPNQKIHYLDRIRRDLADAKHVRSCFPILLSFDSFGADNPPLGIRTEIGSLHPTTRSSTGRQ